jgi:TonB family protein
MRIALAVAFLLASFGSSLAQVQAQTAAPAVPNQASKSDDHSARFGDLAVTVTSMDSKAAATPDRQEVTVFLTVTNTGNGAICATLTAKMEATFALEYSGASGKAPKMRELLPGESAQGSYDFDVKNGVQPLELVLELQGPTLSCSGNAPMRGSIPRQVRLDLKSSKLDAELQKIQDGLPRLDLLSISPGQTARPGTGGVGYPACLYCPEPAYTDEARSAKFEGVVVLQAIIQIDGHAGNIKLVKGSGRADLDSKAIEAVRKWRFKPAVNANGIPVATIVPVEVNFRILRN